MSAESGWLYRRLICGTCGAEIDRQTAKAGYEDTVGVLLNDGVASRVHQAETGCSGGNVVKGDWKPVPDAVVEVEEVEVS